MPTQPNNSGNRAPSNNLNRQIGLYSLAAAVAGVSILALAEPAIGEVVVTRKTIPVPLGTHAMPDPIGISLANNGVNDFSLTLSQNSFSEGRALTVNLPNAPNSKNRVLMDGTFNPYALMLTRGAKIGPQANHFSYGGNIEFSVLDGSVKYCKGYWGSNLQGHLGCGNPKNGYLGVSFQLNAQTHYGWIRLTVTTDPDPQGSPMSAKITGYAYETVPNKPILAGTAGIATATTENPTAELQAPKNIRNQSGPSLGMLALGSDALPMWRREETPVRS